MASRTRGERAKQVGRACCIALFALGVHLASAALLLASEPPARSSQRETAREREQKRASAENLQMLMIALHEYHNVHRRFPPAAVLGPDGKTPHSWRVEILPFVEGGISPKLGRPDHPYQQLYDQYKLDQPWDSPHNKLVLRQMPDVFRCPSDPPDSMKVYFALVGKGVIFDGPAGTPVAAINDGSFRTILLVESRPAAPWTKPVDIPYDPAKPLPKLGGIHAGGFVVVNAGGSRHFLPSDIQETDLRALITCDGKEVVDFPRGSEIRAR
jgi:hypothetical protein